MRAVCKLTDGKQDWLVSASSGESNKQTLKMMNTTAIKAWLKEASARPVVIRAIICAVLVGSVLVGINHGMKIMCNTLTEHCYIQIALTYCVPYMVSTYSSVQATRNSKIKRVIS